MKLRPINKSKEFYTNGETIYYQHNNQKMRPVPNADTETFQVHSYYLASDTNQVYALSTMREGLQIFTPEDRESVIFFPEETSASAFADNYNLYDYNGHFIQYCNIAEETNHKVRIVKWLKKHYPKRNAWWNNSAIFYKKLKPVKHNILTDGNSLFYGFKAKQKYDYPIYEYPYNDYFLQLKDADTNSFEALNSIYSKDKNYVYFYSRKITADFATFQVINNLFAKDKNGIWHNGRFVETVDAPTFQILTKDKGESEFHFAGDANTLYSTQGPMKISKHEGYAMLLCPLKNGDPDTFEQINEVWAKDKNCVYWHGQIYKKADAFTFEKISEPPLTWVDYARDKNHVYIANGQTLKKGLHGGSFKIYNEFWAKDDFVVYNLKTERIQKGIDVSTFEVLDEYGKAQDKDYFYEYKDYSVKKVKKITANNGI